MGHDTMYVKDADDETLIEIAQTEDRVLLTMDRALYRKGVLQSVRVHLVRPVNHLERLASLAAQFNLRLEIEPKDSRCPVCNSPLLEICREEVQGKIPSSSMVVSERFWKCEGCEKFYWHGSHWKDIEARLARARDLIVSE